MFEGEELPCIETPRVRLRHLKTSDADALYDIFSDRETMRYWSSPPFESRAEATELIAEIHECFRQKTLFEWGIARRSDNKIIGTTTLFHLDEKNRRAEVGYALNRRFWGNGFINEALTTLFDLAFGELNLHRLEADVDPQNIASIRVLERLGFLKEGFLRERWFVGDNIQDALFYGLLKRDWEKMKRERNS